MADEARLHELLDIMEQAKSEGDTATAAAAEQDYLNESAPPLHGRGPTKPIATPPPGGFKRGLLDIGQGVKQQILQGSEGDSPYVRRAQAATARAGVTPGSGQTADEYTKQVRGEIAAYEAARDARGETGIDWARAGGRATAALPAAALAGGGGAGAAIAAGAGAGLLTGLSEFAPTTEDRIKNATIGAATGGVLPAVGGVLSAAARPIGATLSAVPKMLLASAKTVPALKGAVKFVEKEIIEPLQFRGWNKELFNRVNPGKKPITEIGQEGQQQLHDAFNTAYKDIWDGAGTIKFKPPKAMRVGKAKVKEVKLTGREIDEQLTRIDKDLSTARRFGRERAMRRLDAEKKAIMDAMPAHTRKELARVDGKFAEYTRVRIAGSSPSVLKRGSFTPDELLSRTVQLDRTAGHGASSRGAAKLEQEALKRLKPGTARMLLSRPVQSLFRYPGVPLAAGATSPDEEYPLSK